MSSVHSKPLTLPSTASSSGGGIANKGAGGNGTKPSAEGGVIVRSSSVDDGIKSSNTPANDNTETKKEGGKSVDDKHLTFADYNHESHKALSTYRDTLLKYHDAVNTLSEMGGDAVTVVSSEVVEEVKEVYDPYAAGGQYEEDSEESESIPDAADVMQAVYNARVKPTQMKGLTQRRKAGGSVAGSVMSGSGYSDAGTDTDSLDSSNTCTTVASLLNPLGYLKTPPPAPNPLLLTPDLNLNKHDLYKDDDLYLIGYGEYVKGGVSCMYVAISLCVYTLYHIVCCSYVEFR